MMRLFQLPVPCRVSLPLLGSDKGGGRGFGSVEFSPLVTSVFSEDERKAKLYSSLTTNMAFSDETKDRFNAAIG